MKRTLIISLAIVLVSQLFISCGKNTRILSQFSKKKYLKLPKQKKQKEEQEVLTYRLNETPILENEEVVSIDRDKTIPETEEYKIIEHPFLIKELQQEEVISEKIVEEENIMISKIEKFQEIKNLLPKQLANEDTDRKLHTGAVTSFTLSFLGILMVFGVPSTAIGIIVAGLSILIGFILGFTSLQSIQQNPNKYIGKGFAIASIALVSAFIIFIIATLIYVSRTYS